MRIRETIQSDNEYIKFAVATVQALYNCNTVRNYVFRESEIQMKEKINN